MREYTITEVASILDYTRQGIHRLLRANGITAKRVDAPIGGVGYYYTISQDQFDELTKIVNEKKSV